jgi:ubiquitin-protein ligase
MKMDANIEMLCNLPHSVLRRRLINEYKQLKIKYNNIVIEFICNSCETIRITIISNSNSNSCNHKFEFIIGKQYPFVQPSLSINGKSYLEYLPMPSRWLHIYNKMYNNKCLCCSSILYNKNWKPSFTIHNIIDEYNETIVAKKNIIIKMLSDTIVDKYLCSDINLDQWLFTLLKH